MLSWPDHQTNSWGGRAVGFMKRRTVQATPLALRWLSDPARLLILHIECLRRWLSPVMAIELKLGLQLLGDKRQVGMADAGGSLQARA